MRIGLALPHYDFSLPAEGRRLEFEAIVEVARRAEALGFDSLWVSDHLSLSIHKYGGPEREWFAYEPLTLLAALARRVHRPRLGTLVLCEALRPAAVAAKALTTVDHLCGGRLDIGLGAGWYLPDYQALGRAELPSPAERLGGLEEALTVLDALLPGGPATLAGCHHRALAATNRPPALQSPRPPLFVGGKGDRLLGLVARRADGWNTCWVWTADAYRERAAALDRACGAVGRDPATVTRSLGLYALAGEDEADLEARFERMRRLAGGVLDATDLGAWRQGRLVGTVEEVTSQLRAWAGEGVSEMICCAGPVPFSLAALDDLEPLARAARAV